MDKRPAETGRMRDTSHDGFRNKLEAFLLTRGRPIWSFINEQRWLRGIVNRLIVNNAVLKAPTRPLPLSTMSGYASWASLTDRTWFSRYLPPKTMEGLPALQALAPLYVTKPGGPRLSQRSTLLFPSFAQWFTDGFLMTDGADRRRTSTNHQIDLSQVYGLNDKVQHALRLQSETAGRKGRLITEILDGEEWAPRLFDSEGNRDPRFGDVPDPLKLPIDLPPGRRASIFAFGGERANATIFTAAINTMFIREHNRLCQVIETANPAWDDERVFQTARNVNIVQLIKVVVEEYINHISPYWFKLLGDPTPSYKARWNRGNWIPVEFNLLYRWHSLIPETILWNGREKPMADMRFDNELLLIEGLEITLGAASGSSAWSIGLFNTAAMLRDVELASIQQGRDNQLASYNDYREVMQYPRISRFEQISGDPDVVETLKAIYGNVDKLEFFVGLFAEDLPERSAVPPLIGRMVALDAFSHALTNPLLSPYVYNEKTFTVEGMSSITQTACLSDIASRNLPGGGTGLHITMDNPAYDSVA